MADNESPFPTPRCVLYEPGHSINWVHWRASTRRPEHHVEVEVVDIGLHTFSVAVLDGVIVYRNHDLVRVREAVRNCGTRGRYVGFGALTIGSTYFNVAEDRGRPLDPCRTVDDVRHERRRDGWWHAPITFADSSIDVVNRSIRRAD